MSTANAWVDVEKPWDIVVVGGGSTGAAVLREAVRCGLRVILFEQADFASGTSSRSTKLAHGGLRYLASLDVGLVSESLRERDRLIAESDGLASPLPFIMASRSSQRVRHMEAVAGTAAYALLAGRPVPRSLDVEALRALEPAVTTRNDVVGLPYQEAAIDDARLVLRLIQEAREAGAVAWNHARVEHMEPHGPGTVLQVRNLRTGELAVVETKAVVNATGAWAGFGDGVRLRPLRGSHLVFSRGRIPLQHGLSFRHPRDGRFVCAVPWEASVLMGTTDEAHEGGMERAPRITPQEFRYLMDAARHAFSSLDLHAQDVVSTFAGVRPVVDDGTDTPSNASREHFVTESRGLVTVSGGKLTTCRLMAHDALQRLEGLFPSLRKLRRHARFLNRIPPMRSSEIPAEVITRLRGRFGARATDVVNLLHGADGEPVAGTSTLWAEVRHALRSEHVEHLDDLMLRRVRLGLLLPNGGAEVLDRVRVMCREELGWDDARWEQEVAAYRALWREEHAVPAVELDAAAVRRSHVVRGVGTPTVTMMDGRIAYADFGGSGRPMVLLHGVGGNHLNWLPAAPMLTEHARVFALDLAGFGFTPDEGRSGSLEQQRLLVDRFLRERVREPAVLVGNSMGGLLALHQTIASPELVAGLVLVSPAQPPPLDVPPDAELTRRFMLHALPGVGEAHLLLSGRQKGARGLFLDLLTLGTVDVTRVPSDVIEANVALIAQRMENAPLEHVGSFLGSTRALAWNLARRGAFDGMVRRVRVPTLLLHGAEDRLVSVKASQRLASLRPDWAFVELEDCGHVPQMECAERFVAVVSTWTRTLDAPRYMAGDQRAA